MSKRPPFLTLWFALGLLGVAAADETLLIRLPTEISTPRSLSLGGALVGLGGDASSFIRNPASIIAVPRSLDGVLAGGNHGGYGGGIALRPYRSLAVGLLFATSDRRAELVSPTPNGAGLLRPRDGRWGAVGLAWTPPIDRRISVGAAVEAEHLLLKDAADHETRTQTKANVTVGLFIQPDGNDGTRVGASYRFGMDRTFDVLPGGLGLADEYATYRVRRPGVLAFGASWRYGWFKNTHVTFTVQPEVVFFRQVLDAEVGNELDFRGGMEVSRPFPGCISGCGGMWQLRAGLVSRAAIPTFVPTSGEGYDPGRRSTTVVFGASVAPERPFSGKVKFDVGYSFACDSLDQHCNTLMFGVSVRFPTAYRGDLKYHRVRR